VEDNNDEPMDVEIVDDEVIIDDIEEVVNEEEVVAYPNTRVEVAEEEARVVLYDSLRWLCLLVKLEKVLKEEMKVRRALVPIIEDELKEVKKEKERALWKLGWALSVVKEVPEIPEELINQAMKAFNGPEPTGSSRPWIIVDLMKRYKIR